MDKGQRSAADSKSAGSSLFELTAYMDQKQQMQLDDFS
ncbi:hypothetical protein GYO_2902 [Bacillus spizizenii TU-B-10]|uniref:Uncharacterized protein n=1 Tax=Bacillus spizizenii (strain DSM 15029 / JCM 12233 / NBRC 101239 / NRRL B-23049 / TU-B-10) TaxID=1052585 RepID=G4NXR9_BACS4|nr:hypothetical protein GYO_2902 [Bacillus spizizenii TU-B-10]